MAKTYDYYIALLKIKSATAACLFFETRHDNILKQDLLDLGYTVFEVRHRSGDWCSPYTIEKAVLVDFLGYGALKDETAIGFLDKKLEKDSFFQVNSYSLNLYDDGSEYRENSEIPADLVQYSA